MYSEAGRGFQGTPAGRRSQAPASYLHLHFTKQNDSETCKNFKCSNLLLRHRSESEFMRTLLRAGVSSLNPQSNRRTLQSGFGL